MIIIITTTTYNQIQGNLSGYQLNQCNNYADEFHGWARIFLNNEERDTRKGFCFRMRYQSRIIDEEFLPVPGRIRLKIKQRNAKARGI